MTMMRLDTDSQAADRHIARWKHGTHRSRALTDGLALLAMMVAVHAVIGYLIVTQPTLAP